MAILGASGGKDDNRSIDIDFQFYYPVLFFFLTVPPGYYVAYPQFQKLYSVVTLRYRIDAMCGAGLVACLKQWIFGRCCWYMAPVCIFICEVLRLEPCGVDTGESRERCGYWLPRDGF